jgi:hypothetical protein
MDEIGIVQYRSVLLMTNNGHASTILAIVDFARILTRISELTLSPMLHSQGKKRTVGQTITKDVLITAFDCKAHVFSCRFSEKTSVSFFSKRTPRIGWFGGIVWVLYISSLRDGKITLKLCDNEIRLCYIWFRSLKKQIISQIYNITICYFRSRLYEKQVHTFYTICLCYWFGTY